LWVILWLSAVVCNLFFTRGTSSLVKDMMALHKISPHETGVRTYTWHKYVSTCKSLSYKNAGIWKQNVTHVE
jgi:hypothetical protein